MRADAGVEGGVVFENYDGGFDGIDSRAACCENFPACFQGAANAVTAIFDGFIGDIPGAAVNDEGGFHVARVVRGFCRAEA